MVEAYIKVYTKTTQSLTLILPTYLWWKLPHYPQSSTPTRGQ